MISKIAKYLSVIGHPLLTIPIFVVSTLFYYEDFNRALLPSTLIVFGIIVPLIIKMYISERKGVYKNFDVSDREERKSWYFYAIALLSITVIILFVTDQPRTIRFGFLLSALLLLTSQIVNYYIKSSLHVSFNIFLSFLIIPINIYIAFLFFLFVFFIAWARVYLRRHTIKEIITGVVIGLIFGLLLLATFFDYNQY